MLLIREVPARSVCL